jgi:hypothetical protein
MRPVAAQQDQIAASGLPYTVLRARHTLPPTEQRLGFVGYASSTACQLTSEISAHWLSQTFRGEQTPPAVDEMKAKIQRVHALLADVLPAAPRGHFLGPYLTHHLDDLVTDMGVPRRRTRNVFTEYLGPFSPAGYCDIAEQRRTRQSGTLPPPTCRSCPGRLVRSPVALTRAPSFLQPEQIGL